MANTTSRSSTTTDAPRFIPTHVVSFNNRTKIELQPSDGTVEERLVQLLGRLNGTDRYSLILWKLPSGQRLCDVDVKEASGQYIQTAGDFNSRMTAEVREVVDSTPQQYVIGRAPGDPDETGSDGVVPWNGYEARVRTNEVLSGSEVSEVFVSYYRTGQLPSSFVRRPIDV